MGEWSHFEVSQDGQLLEDQGRLRCPGEGPGPRGQPAPPYHILMELQVKIKLEHLVANLGRVSSEDGGLRLPCLVRENGCQTLHKTYVWPGETGNCQLKYIRTIAPNRKQVALELDWCVPSTGL
ncbi:MAG: hypothetical protein GY696_22235 [Gammaproteobacteria bacterium]|nr:hypothetical protein [Gammaproteobacteria bacterium]